MTAGEGVPPLTADAPATGNGASGNGNGASTATRPAPDAADASGPDGDATIEPPLAPAEGDERRGGGHLAYNPALDGIRGLAVGAVLFFHGGFAWARGGFLGVSTFFTLSGFLITSLLVAEVGRTGGVKLTAFWARRLRRLLPASALTLSVLLLLSFVLNEGWERALPGDVIASALNVANWHFLFDERSYAALFDSPSPALHFWSLAIEEQFYWVFPVLTAGVFAVSKGSVKAFAAALGGLLAIAAGLTLIYRDRPDTVYYATPIRMGEIVVGALLAVALAQGRMEKLRRFAPLAVVVGLGALAVSAWAWFNIEQQTPSLYKGGLLIYALVSGALVLSACVDGPVKRALGFEPLRLLGVVSYGVYLFHWPVFLVMSEARVDGWLGPLDIHPRGSKLFVLRVLVTLALAVVSYHLLEQPIRTGKRPHLRLAIARPPLLAAVTVTAIVLAALIFPKISEPPVDPFEAYTAALNGPEPAALASDAQIGVTLGDSTMLRTAWGLSAWGQDHQNRLVLTGGSADVGCGVGRGGKVRYLGVEGDLKEPCQQWATTLPQVMADTRDRYGRVDFAVVQTGPWDVADRQLEGDDQWRHIGDPVYDDYLRSELDAANQLLVDEGVIVVWLTAPPIEAGKNQEPPPSEPYPESDPERMRLLNDMIRELADQREGVVVVDLAAWVESLPPGEDERLRPDGVHFELETAVDVADWLAPQVMAATLSERPPGAPPVGGVAPTSTTTLADPNDPDSPTTAPAGTDAGASGS
jgi:peptidoglycan/LPS O-acetylase OafA/YrhL